MLPLAELINKEKSLYTNVFEKKDLVDIDEEMPDKNKVIKMLKVKLITPKSKYTTST